MPKRTLRFLLYTIHGHVGGGNPDYLKLAKQLVKLRGRHWQQGKRVIAFGGTLRKSASARGERVALILYSGDADKSVLFFDLNRQSEFNSLLESGRFVARKTHAVIDLAQRVLMIEAARGHPQAEELAKIIEEHLRAQPEFATLELSFVPIAAPTFASKIDAMQRIQAVTVSIARPNVDWGDRYSQLTNIADESKAKAIDTTVRARRNDSLSKHKGIIPSLKHWLADAYSSVSSARIKGSLPGSTGLIELKLSDHVETVTLTTDTTSETGYPLDSEIQEKLDSYLDQRSERR